MSPTHGVLHEEGDGAPSSSAQKQQYDLLGATQIVSFTATPPSIGQFEKSTLSWTVKLPTHLLVPVRVGVAGHFSAPTPGGHEVSDSTVVTPWDTTQYGITLETAIVSRSIGSCVVQVDTSGCLPEESIPSGTINYSVRAALNPVLQGLPSSLRLRGDGVSAKTVAGATIGAIVVAIPLAISVPHWFDGTIDISIIINVGLQGVPPSASLAVNLNRVDVDPEWTWYSDVLSLGNTYTAARVADQIVTAFLQYLAVTQFVPQVASQLQAAIDTFLSLAKANDLHHRTFTVTEFSADDTGIVYRLCPLPQPPTPPPPSH